MRSPELRHLCILGMLAAIGGCTPDVNGQGPTNGDIVDFRDINVFQSGARFGGVLARPPGPVHTQHPECDDGRCIDLRFVLPLCRALPVGGAPREQVAPADFQLVVWRVDEEGAQDEFDVICGDSIIDKVLLASSTAPRPFADPVELAAAGLDQCSGSAGEQLDTVSLHLSTDISAVLALIPPVPFEIGRTEVFVRLTPGQSTTCAGDGFPLVVEDIEVVPGQGECDFTVFPPQCTLGTRVTYSTRSAISGFAGAFTIDDPRVGEAPEFAESQLRARGSSPEGRLVDGDCPPQVCGGSRGGPILGWTSTRYFPPHGRLRSRFAADDEAGLADCVDSAGAARPCDREPSVLGLMVEVGGGTYFSPADLVARAAPIEIVNGLGAPFDPTACAGDRECLTMEVVPAGAVPGSVLPMGLHVRSLEILADDSFIFAGDPVRFELPPPTQSSQGEDFERGAYGDGLGEFTVSLVELIQDELDVPFGGSATLEGRLADALGAPYASRIELAVGSDGGIPITTTGTTFTVSIGSEAEYDIRTELTVHAYDAADRHLGYDVIPVTLRGELGPSPGPINIDPRADTDLDGVVNEDEVVAGTSTVLSDTDGDGIEDGDELDASLDPTSVDSDGDGVLDGDEDADGNFDGVPDNLDPDNSTIGIDASDSLFLVQERWSTNLGFTVAEEEMPGSPPGNVYDVDSDVEFTLTYALVAEAVGPSGASDLRNWLTEDPATPLPLQASDEGWEVRFRAVRLDSIGVPYVRDIEVRTSRCDVAGLVGQQCDLVPVQLVTTMTGPSWPEHVAWVLPTDNRMVDGVSNVRTEIGVGPTGDTATYHIAVYPQDGFSGRDSTDVPLGGWGPIDEHLGGAAHYLGRDPDGQVVSMDRGTRLLVNSLQPSAGSNTHFNGPAFLLCSRTPMPGGTGLFPVGHPMRLGSSQCVALRVDGNGFGSGDVAGPTPIPPRYYDNSSSEREFPAVDLGFFGGIRVRGASPSDTRVAATYSVDDDQLFDLMRGRANGEISISKSSGGSGPLAGSLTASGYPSFLAQIAGGTGLQRLTRSVRTVVVNPGPRFVDSVRRESFEQALSDLPMHVEGTDTAWTGRVGYRSEHRTGTAPQDAEQPESADWFRLHVALAEPTRPQHQRALDYVMERCRQARTSGTNELEEALPDAMGQACIAHLRVQAENLAVHSASGSRCRQSSDPSDFPLLRGPALECIQELRQDRSVGGRVRPEAVVLSQDVPVDHLWRPNSMIEPTENRGGVLLRWTGQPETYNTLNRLPGMGDTQGQFAQIVGCHRFPSLTDVSLTERVVETDDTIVHPGSYSMHAFMERASFRGGPPSDTRWTCSAFGAGIDPPVDPAASTYGPRQPISIGLPVVVGPLRDAAFSSFMAATFAGQPVAEVRRGLQRELVEFWRDLGSGVDVVWHPDFAGSLGGAGPVLPPFAGLYIATDAVDEARCAGSFGLPPDEGVAGRAFVPFDGLQARGAACLFEGAFDGLDRSVCRTARSPIIPGAGAADPCAGSPGVTCGRVGSPFEGTEPLMGTWPLPDALNVGRTIGWVGLHEIGHTAGLTHVQQALLRGENCAGGSTGFDCIPLIFCGREGVGEQIHVGPVSGDRGRFLHPLTSPARPVTSSAADACTVGLVNEGISVPQRLYRGVVRYLPDDPREVVERRALREASMAEPNRGGRVLREPVLCPDGETRSWFQQDVPSLRYLFAQFGRGL